jgi:hypothetical protein
MEKLSDTAMVVACLIHEHTIPSPDGHGTVYWVPSAYETFITMLEETVLVHGGNMARILKSFQAKGLTRQTREMRAIHPYACAATEKLTLLLEQQHEWVEKRLEANRREAARLAARYEVEDEDQGSNEV